MRFLLLLSGALLLLAYLRFSMPHANAMPATPETINIRAADINISTRYYAQVTPGSAAVLLLHGWGRPNEDPARQLESAARQFQHRGFAVLVPTQRGWPPTGGVDDCAAQQVDDAVQLLSWLRAQDDVDADNVFVAGYSQGGQIALLTAARDPRITAVTAYAPVTELQSWARETSVPGIRDYVLQECGDQQGWRQRSVLAVADSISQPLLLVHGMMDTRVPTSQSIQLYQAMRASNADTRLHLVDGVGHTLDEILDPGRAISFFQQHAKRS